MTMTGPTMTFHVARCDDGTVHVQNVLAGMFGQHHVHTPEGFDAWRKPGDDVREGSETRCDCGLKPGEKRSGK